MPYRTFSTPFTGDDDIADFMLDVWLAFATDTGVAGGMAWIDQNAGARGTHPDYEFWVSKGSLITPAPPYVFYRTTADNMSIFTGNGINLLQEIFDQPNNPMNCPAGTTLSPDYSTGNYMRLVKAPYMNRVDGVYEKAWLFGDIASTYIHCVIKTRAREYRHFHVGMLKPLHSDLDADSFYVTGHAWSYLREDENGFTDSSQPPTGVEHDPYGFNHAFPFANNTKGLAAQGLQFQCRGISLYMPNLGANTEDWYACRGTDEQTTGTGTFTIDVDISKPVGDVNNTSSSTFFGMAQITGHNNGLGAILFAADKTFTSNFSPLIPIYVTAYTNFASDIRQAPVAQIPDVFRVSMKNLDDEQEITVGSDTYTVFPVINQDSANILDGEGYSAYEGLAYKKITADIT